jgi:hypothetical protein
LSDIRKKALVLGEGATSILDEEWGCGDGFAGCSPREGLEVVDSDVDILFIRETYGGFVW